MSLHDLPLSSMMFRVAVGVTPAHPTEPQLINEHPETTSAAEIEGPNCGQLLSIIQYLSGSRNRLLESAGIS